MQKSRPISDPTTVDGRGSAPPADLPVGAVVGPCRLESLYREAPSGAQVYRAFANERGSHLPAGPLAVKVVPAVGSGQCFRNWGGRLFRNPQLPVVAGGVALFPLAGNMLASTEHGAGRRERRRPRSPFRRSCPRFNGARRGAPAETAGPTAFDRLTDRLQRSPARGAGRDPATTRRSASASSCFNGARRGAPGETAQREAGLVLAHAASTEPGAGRRERPWRVTRPNGTAPGASTEPGAGRRERQVVALARVLACLASTEPGAGRREQDEGASTEPGAGRRERRTMVLRCVSRSDPLQRSPARGAGRDEGGKAALAAVTELQRSPARGAGRDRRGCRQSAAGPGPASTEPGAGRRERPLMWPQQGTGLLLLQRSPARGAGRDGLGGAGHGSTSPCFNGARRGVPGETRTRASCPTCSPARFNGARRGAPGETTDSSAAPAADVVLQRSPARGAGRDQAERGDPAAARPASTEPGAGRGERQGHRDRAGRLRVASTEPGAGRRERLPRVRPQVGDSPASTEPGAGRRERPRRWPRPSSRQQRFDGARRGAPGETHGLEAVRDHLRGASTEPGAGRRERQDEAARIVPRLGAASTEPGAGRRERRRDRSRWSWGQLLASTEPGAGRRERLDRPRVPVPQPAVLQRSPARGAGRDNCDHCGARYHASASTEPGAGRRERQDHPV